VRGSDSDPGELSGGEPGRGDDVVEAGGGYRVVPIGQRLRCTGTEPQVSAQDAVQTLVCDDE